jgi:RNA polymerase sigma-70 factor (ECF subfamily)
METPDLASLATQWSIILRAGQKQGDAAAAARSVLLLRYHEAIMRYLKAALRDEHAAWQVYSNFAVRVLQVDQFLQRADPSRGRFRDYLKTILRHMVSDYYRERHREHRQLEEFARRSQSSAEPDTTDSAEDLQFLSCWREELMHWARQRLEDVERKTGQPYATLLHLLEEQPELRSSQAAELLSAQMNRPFTADGVRQLKHRGRELFGEMLVRETARSLQVDLHDPEGANRIEQELIDLGLLLSYCKAALDRFRKR